MIEANPTAGADLLEVAPPLYRRTIRRRPSLWRKLEQGQGRRLLVVQAGTGYGKSVFLADFARAGGGSHKARAAWLTLTPMHLDRVQLLQGLVLAIHSVEPGIGNVTLDALRKSRDAIRRWEYFLELFCHEVCSAEGRPSRLILDQYERVAASSGAREIVDYLIGAMPKDFSVVLSTRRSPDLASMPRLQADDDAWQLSSADLCFTADEARELLSNIMGLAVSEKAVKNLMSMTGGWPAMVQIAGAFAACRGERALLEYSGSDPKFYECLCDEVFRQESKGDPSYPMALSLVDRVDPRLSRYLADHMPAADVFTRFDRGNYVGLEAEAGDELRYCHNPVFRSFVLQEMEVALPEDEAQRLHLRLARYYEEKRGWDASIHHFLKAGDYERASELVGSIAEDAISNNNVETLARWIDAFPERERKARPWLLLYRGVVYRLSLEWDRALALYNKAADIFREQGDRKGLARALWFISQVLAYSRNQRLAIVLAEEAIAYLDPSDDRARAWILHSMGNSYFDLGRTGDALASHERSKDLFKGLGDTHGEMIASQALGFALHRLGRLKEAQQNYVDGLKLQARTGDINMLCWLQAGLSHLRAMRGDYSDATLGLREIVEMARKHHLRLAEAFALSRLADVYMDLASYAEAEDCCRQALAAGEGKHDSAQMGVRLRLMELEFRMGEQDAALRGRLSLSVSDWAATSQLDITRIAHDLLRAAVSLAEQRFQEAEQLAADSRSLASKIGARYHEVQACYLLGRARLLQGDLEGSAALVDELIPALEEEGYTGFLLRDPQATGDLLANAFRHSPARDRVMTLLMRLVVLREEVGVPLQQAENAPSGDQVLNFRNKLLSQAAGLASMSADRDNGPASKQPAQCSLHHGPKHEDPRRVMLEVMALGPMIVRRHENPITDRAWRTSKAKELFAYLLTRSERSASRDELLEVLWPELGADSAVSNFHFTAHSLRHALEPHLPPRAASSFLVLYGRQYRLELPDRTWIDVDEFRSCIARGLECLRAHEYDKATALLERSTGLYRGNYLADLYVDWTEVTRQEVERSYLHALRNLARLAYARRDYDRVLANAGAMLKHDNYREDAYRLIMRAECETGNHALALRRFDDLARLLHHELGIQPEASTRLLYRQIREGTYKRGGAGNNSASQGHGSNLEQGDSGGVALLRSR